MQQTSKNTKNIIILGAGFCGLQIAKNLAFILKDNKEYRIILVNKKSVHVYHADLYEISTAFNKRITAACMRSLKQSVCLDIRKALKGLHVQFHLDEIVRIDHERKNILFKKGGEIQYEYLALALGSVTNYYNIPGLLENAFPLKTLEDALALNCEVDQFFRQRWQKKKNDKVSIIIGGGGATGAEYACEVIGYIQKLSQKYKFNRDDVSVSIIQGNSEFVGLGKKVSDITIKRFKKLGIQIMTNTYITKVDKTAIEVFSKLDNKKTTFPADILIWTGGIMPNPLLKNFPILHTSGGIEVSPTLESIHYQKVYAGGDNAVIFDPFKPGFVAKVAPYALQAGKTIAYNIAADIQKLEQKTFQPKEKGYFVALGGKYFVYKKGKIVLKGFIPFLLRKLHDLRYFSQVISFKTALEKLKQSENIFEQNDT